MTPASRQAKVDAALVALQAGRDAEALLALIETWQAEPAPALANAIDAVGARLDATRARPIGRSPKDKQTSWHQLADKHGSADVGVLLETFADIPRSSALVGRIDKLASRPPDPRISIKLALLAEDWPILGYPAFDSLRRAFALVVRIADYRTIAVLEQILASSDTYMTRGLTPAYIATYVEQLRAAAPYRAGPNVEPLMAWLAADAAARVGPVTDDDALFAAVYANPADDGPRLVLADFLQQRGDPRGELIALQLVPPFRSGAKLRRAREQELLKTYGREWLGPLEPTISKHGATFARGFLAKCAVREPGRSALARVLDAVEWATVDELDATGWQEPAIRSPQLMPVLRWLRGVRNFVPSHPHLQHVEIETLESAAQLANLVAPKLHSVTINVATFGLAELAPFWETPVGRQLEYFAIDVPDIGPWMLDLWSRVSPRGRLQRAILSMRGTSPWRFWIEADGALRCEKLWVFDAAREQFDDLAAQLDALDRSMFSTIRLAFRDEPSPRLAAAIRRFDR